MEYRFPLSLCINLRKKYAKQAISRLAVEWCPGGGGGLPYIKGGDAGKISNEPLKGTNLGVA